MGVARHKKQTMVLSLSIIPFIFLMYTLFRTYPAIKDKKSVGFGVLCFPFVLLWHAMDTALDAYNKSYHSHHCLGSGIYIACDPLGSNGFIENISYFYIFAAICCVGYLIYEIYLDAMKWESNVIIWVMRATAIVGVIGIIVRIDPALHYTLVDFLVLLLGGSIFICLWYYFEKSIETFGTYKSERARITENDEKEVTGCKIAKRSKTEELLDLKNLMDSGVIDKDEMEKMKKKILNNDASMV